MLLPAEAALWLRLNKAVLMRKTKGRNPQIPCFRIAPNKPLFHPRTVIAKMQADAGLSTELTKASLAISEKPKL
jgi:hypothetical protein